ncbi:MAG: SAM-dependent methyltransferase [bacterium]
MIEIFTHSSVLSEQLRKRIRREGPITFCEWMRTALYDNVEGYYCKPYNQIWGREGDYRTSPERSYLFAATFARYFASLYQQLGSPPAFTIVEIGGGAGHFALGVLQTLQRYFPHSFAATHYIFDEIGDPARTSARERLASFGERVVFGSSDDVEIDPGIVFTNELLDAFPVHRVTMVDGDLCEYYVALGVGGQFDWMIGPPSTSQLAGYLRRYDIHLREGQIAEISLEIEKWVRKAAGKLPRGYVITVDYGAEATELYSSVARAHGTLRSFQQHVFVEKVLALPGEHDLTSTVNWTAVKAAGESAGLRPLQLVRLDKFLLEAGLLDQLALESQRSDEADKLRLSTTAREMILPNGMAASFQVLLQEKLSAGNMLGAGA